ncbi:MAG: hypothetical protein WDZ77_02130 [Candidatus Pacearchaeota archaeon]
MAMEGIFSWTSIFVLTMISLGIWFVIEMKRFQHKLIAIGLIVLVIVGYAGMATIGQNNNVDLTTIGGIVEATKLYASWIGGFFSNLKAITTQAISLDWFGNHTST